MTRLVTGRKRPAAAPFTARLAPGEGFIAVGDVHGSVDLLETLLRRVVQESDVQPLVLVGDYIDRGADSAAVLRLLRDTCRSDPHVHCLMGNHEEMLIGFLDDPEKQGRSWIRNGGLQTLASFGIGQVSLGASAGQLCKARDALAYAMGDDLITWLRQLPAVWQSGNVAVVHAGADPATPLAAQARASLIWGHRDFHTQPRQDATWILHGHNVVAAPEMREGRIAIDTGAYATGRLSAAIVTNEGVRFVTT